MTTLKQILADYAPEYIQRFADAMPVNHRKTLEAVVHCRTDFFGATVYRCENCGKNHLVYRCCGNRHCPSCQNHKTRKWLENRLDAMLPVHHFMITFTVPEAMRSFIRSNQRMALCGDVCGIFTDTEKVGSGYKICWRRPARLFRRFAHVGTDLVLPSAYSLHRARRWVVQVRSALASFTQGLFPAGKGHVQNL